MNEGTKTETASPEQIIPNSRYKLNENNKQFIFRLPSSIRCPLCCVCVYHHEFAISCNQKFSVFEA